MDELQIRQQFLIQFYIVSQPCPGLSSSPSKAKPWCLSVVSGERGDRGQADLGLSHSLLALLSGTSRSAGDWAEQQTSGRRFLLGSTKNIPTPLLHHQFYILSSVISPYLFPTCIQYPALQRRNIFNVKLITFTSWW